jgi:exonuclease SbcD
MTKLRFIHTSDLHLDTPFKGLSSWNTDLAARLKDAAFKSFRRIIDICIEQEADFPTGGYHPILFVVIMTR